MVDTDCVKLGVGRRPGRHRRLGAVLRDDSGFTLIEAVVALAIATTVFTALAYAATTAIKSTQIGRQNQQAADLANQAIEDTRSIDWGALFNDPTTLQCGTDPNLNCAGDPTIQVDGVSEPVLEKSGGLVGVSPDGIYPVTYAINNVDYQVFTYVTTPDGGDGDSRRVTAYVNWDDYGNDRTRIASTIVTNSTRGLPLPEYNLTWASPTEVTVNPGSLAAWKIELTNQGAPDSFDISNGETNPLQLKYYLPDANGDLPDPLPAQGLTQVPDKAGGQPALIADQSASFFAVCDEACTAALANNTYEASVVSQSVTQPDADSAVEVIDLSLVVTDQVIGGPGNVSSSFCAADEPLPTLATVSGYNQVAYKLHNSGNADWPEYEYVESPPDSGNFGFWLPTTGNSLDSTTQSPMAMNYIEDYGIRVDKLNPGTYPNPTLADLPALPAYSTDLEPTSTPGRLLYPGTTASTSVAEVANWQGDRVNRDYRGNMTLRLFVKPVSGVNDVQLAAEVFRYDKKKNSGTVSDVLTPARTSTAPAGGSTVSISNFSSTCGDGKFQEVWFAWDSIVLNGPNGNKAQQVLGVRIFNVNSSSGSKFSVGYDHEAYPATLQAVEE